jgi:hypothetical protein
MGFWNTRHDMHLNPPSMSRPVLVEHFMPLKISPFSPLTYEPKISLGPECQD